MIVTIQDERSSGFLPTRIFELLHAADRPAWTPVTTGMVAVAAVVFSAIAGLGLYSVLVDDSPAGYTLTVPFGIALVWLVGAPGRERTRMRRRAARHVARTARRLGLISRIDALAFTWRARLTLRGGHEITLERRYRRRSRRLVASLTSTLGNIGRFRVLDITDDPAWQVMP